MLRARTLLLIVLLTAAPGWADEGMWPYNHLPLDDLRSRYGFEPEAGFFDKLQSASVRFNNGGSGSFVSATGMVMTNHHVASGCIRQLSSEKKDYVQDGFYATRRSAELKCPNLELNVLKRIEPVTDQVNADVTAEMSDKQRQDAQKAATAHIEKDCRDSTLNRCDVVNFYSGGVFDLYEYKRYTDVRLVFAPEYEAAFFGGDTDNFTYPRYCLDVAFLRVYEKGAAIESPAYLPWGDGAEAGDLVFVSGHPGTTNRLLTVSQFLFQRDRRIPFSLDWLDAMTEAFRSFGRGGGDAERLARDELFRFNNGVKNYRGQIRGLRLEELVRAKKLSEERLMAVVAEGADAEKHAASWKAIATAQRVKGEIYEEQQLLGGFGFYSRLFSIARHLYRLSSELAKPNEDRLPEYRDSGLDSLYQNLYSPAPIYDDVETIKLAESMQFMRDRLGFDHPVVETALGDKNASLVAKRLIARTKLKDVAVRKQLAADRAAAAAESKDPLIRLAAAVDEYSREIRKRYEDEVEAVENAHGARIAQARFAARGQGVYPDATFTLRLSSGVVKGYREAGMTIPPFTTIEGLFEKAGDEAPYKLPKRFMTRKRQVKLETPYNLVSTNDITGGNSGSPLINRAGEIVGIIFDGNIHQLVNDFHYSDSQGRAVSVDSRGILEALGKIYRARRVVAELKPASR